MSPEYRFAAGAAAAFACICAIGYFGWLNSSAPHTPKRPAHPQRITYVYDQRSQRCKAIVQWCASQPPEVRPIACADALRALGVPGAVDVQGAEWR